MTLQDQICRGLSRLGYRYAPTETTDRFIAFHARLRPGHHVYVGRLGAVRTGDSVAGSVSAKGGRINGRSF
jgi:hypothetical protein